MLRRYLTAAQAASGSYTFYDAGDGFARLVPDAPSIWAEIAAVRLRRRRDATPPACPAF